MFEEDLENLFSEDKLNALRSIERVSPPTDRQSLLVRFVHLLESEGNKEDNSLFEEAVRQILMLGSVDLARNMITQSKRDLSKSFLESFAFSLSSAIRIRAIGGQLEETV